MSFSFYCNSPEGKKAGLEMKTRQEAKSEKEKTEQDTKTTYIVAEIELFLPVAIDALGSTPADSLSVPGTYLRVESPQKYEDKKFYIYHPGTAEDVPKKWKRKKQKVRFQVKEQDLLEQFQKNGRWLYTAELKDIEWL